MPHRVNYFHTTTPNENSAIKQNLLSSKSQKQGQQDIEGVRELPKK